MHNIANLDPANTSRKMIIVGVGAGIAAYKIGYVVRDLIREGHDVHVIPTPASLNFVGAATWQALSGNPVHSGIFEAGGADHIELARRADLILVAPATANLLSRIHAGAADDLLTATILAASCPIVLAPAMHSNMWLNSATQENISVLRGRGINIIEPVTGDLGSGDKGIGRLPEPRDIVTSALDILGRDETSLDLKGLRILVTAGGTREPIDPVRFLGNNSTGRQGCEIAAAAAKRGAEVILVAANIFAELIPEGVAVVEAVTALEMEKAVLRQLRHIDVLVKAAAVADFRPTKIQPVKIKKKLNSCQVPKINLERTTDILAAATSSVDRPAVVVGFAAETGDFNTVLKNGQEKARAKGADLLAVNIVGFDSGFGDVENALYLLNSAGEQVASYAGDKAELANGLLNEIATILTQRGLP